MPPIFIYNIVKELYIYKDNKTLINCFSILINKNNSNKDYIFNKLKINIIKKVLNKFNKFKINILAIM